MQSLICPNPSALQRTSQWGLVPSASSTHEQAAGVWYTVGDSGNIPDVHWENAVALLCDLQLRVESNLELRALAKKGAPTRAGSRLLRGEIAPELTEGVSV